MTMIGNAQPGLGTQPLGGTRLLDLNTPVTELAFDNAASKSNSLSASCGRTSNTSNKCYHASSNRRVGG